MQKESSNRSRFLSVALQAAQAAEEIIMKYYRDDIRISLKADQSPVTIADEKAEEAIIEIIHTAFPDHGIFGEETGVTKARSEYAWTVDPIDGTKNYIRQLPLFGTLISLMRNDEVIVGVSNMPVMKERLYAEKGKGAFKGETRLEVSKINNLHEAYISFGGIGSFEKRNLTPQILRLVDTAARSRSFGDCWPYHLVAEGKIDVVIDPKVHLWDVAPAKIIIEEAGGSFTDSLGNPLGEGTFIGVATNGRLHEETLKYLNS